MHGLINFKIKIKIITKTSKKYKLLKEKSTKSLIDGKEKYVR
jgi:hypothetical protein